jgi:hypothetical protein
MKFKATLFARVFGGAGFLCGVLGLAGSLFEPAGNLPPHRLANQPAPMATNPSPQITLQAPLVGMDVACAALKLRRADVMALIDEGQIAWAFNFALRQEAKPEVRILAASLSDYQNGQQRGMDAAADLARVMEMIFPDVARRAGVVASIPASALALRLSVSTEHIFNLIRAHTLAAMAVTTWRRGPKGSPRVQFASVERFLEQRRIV